MMKTYSNKSIPEDRNRTTPNEGSLAHNDQALSAAPPRATTLTGFEDNRSQAVVQGKLQALANNGCTYGKVQAKRSQPPAIQSKSFHTFQRQVEDWPIRKLAADTHVYHNTSAANAYNIIENHIKPVANAFGGGQLGGGFYTYTVQASAELFGGNTTLKFKTTAQATGQDVPNDATWDKFPPYAEKAVAGNDFLWTDEDPNQYKFHGGGKLELVAIIDKNAEKEYTVEAYKKMLTGE